MSDGPFKQKLFETEIELRLVPVELDMDAKNATYETTRAELYQWCADIANAAYRELHPPVSEGMKFDLMDVEMVWHKDGQSHAMIKLEVANAKLQRILAQGVRVFKINKSDLWSEEDSDLRQTYAISHSGIVINIEDVTK